MKTIDDVMGVVETALGKEFPDALKPVIEEHMGKVWEFGGTYKAVKTTVASDMKAVQFFSRVSWYDFGKIFNLHQEDLKSAVKEALGGKSVRPRAAKLVATKTKKELEAKKMIAHYEFVVEHAANRSRNFSRVLAYKELGFTEMIVRAILDQKTSKICKVMNGRIIKMKTAAKFVQDFMNTDPNAVVEKFSWPKEGDVNEAKSTDDLVDSIKCKLAPYHGRCRTQNLVHRRVRVKNRKGKTLGKKKRPDLKKVQNKTVVKKSLKERMVEYDRLTDAEFDTKINAHRSAKWQDDELLTTHRKKHERKLGVAGDKAYQKLSEKVLQEFDSVYIYRHGDSNRLMFYNKDQNIVTAVDSDNNRIASCFKPDARSLRLYKNTYIKLEP